MGQGLDFDVVVGLDVGKATHHAVALDREGRRLVDLESQSEGVSRRSACVWARLSARTISSSSINSVCRFIPTPTHGGSSELRLHQAFLPFASMMFAAPRPRCWRRSTGFQATPLPWLSRGASVRKSVWPGAGSNRRPSDFQSDARTN